MRINKVLIEDTASPELIAENSDYRVYKVNDFTAFHELAGHILSWASAQAPTAWRELRVHSMILRGKKNLWYHALSCVLVLLPKQSNLDPYYIGIADPPFIRDIPYSAYPRGIFQFHDKNDVSFPPNVVPPKVNFPEIQVKTLTIKPVVRIHNGLEIEDDTRTLIDVGPDTHKLIIPDSVRIIGNSCCKDYLYLRQVIMPDTVLHIEPAAFRNCRYLNLVQFSNSLQTIGENSFRLCESLTSLDLPDSLTEIGDWAFAFMGSLPKIEIPNSVTKLGKGLFQGCKVLREVTLPASIREIPAGFLAQSGIKNFTIPNGVTTIGVSAFDSCKQLSQVYIPASVTFIDRRAFHDCYKRMTVHYAGTRDQLLTILAKLGPHMIEVFVTGTKIDCMDGVFNYNK